MLEFIMFLVYAIFNRKHNKIYIGQTKDLEERIDLHNKGIFKTSFTSRYDGIWILIYKEEFSTRQEALIREKQFKSYRGREFVKRHIPL